MTKIINIIIIIIFQSEIPNSVLFYLVKPQQSALNMGRFGQLEYLSGQAILGLIIN